MTHEKKFTEKLTDFMSFKTRRARKSAQKVEKIDLTRFFTEKIPRRNPMSAYLKQQIAITFEVRDMFKIIEPTQLDAMRQTDNSIETRGLSQLETITKTQISKKDVFVPTREYLRPDPVLGTCMIKSDYVTRKVKVREEVQVLNWNKLTKNY